MDEPLIFDHTRGEVRRGKLVVTDDGDLAHRDRELALVQAKNERLRKELAALNRATAGSVEAKLRDEIKVYRKGLSHIVHVSATSVPHLKDIAAITLRDGDAAHEGQAA